MRKYMFLLLILFFSLSGFNIKGYLWEDHNVLVSPNLGMIPNTCILEEVIPLWDAAIHYNFGYFVSFQYETSNTSPYNMNWGISEGSAETNTISTEDYIDTNWVIFDSTENWNYENSPSSNEWCFKSVAKHEVGHMCGLDHSDIVDAVMYDIEKGQKRVYPQDDDAQGMACIYGDEYLNIFEQWSPWMPHPNYPGHPGRYVCFAPLRLGWCKNGQVNPNQTVKVFISYDGGQTWQKRWQGQAKRFRAFNFSVKKTSNKAKYKARWYDNGNVVAERETGLFKTYYRKEVCMEEESWEITTSQEVSNCVCQTKEEYKIWNNVVYSLYDKVGRPIIKHKRGNEIKEYLLKSGSGLFFLRKESPNNIQLKKLIILEGNIIFDNKR